MEQDQPARVLVAELARLQTKFAERDMRMRRIALCRTPGGIRQVAPEMFPDDESSYSEAMVANTVDIAARDLSEVSGKLPSIDCHSAVATSDRRRAFAEKRTQIANGYVHWSDLAVQMVSAADRYHSYGFLPGRVRLDFKRKRPVIELMDPRGCYYVTDTWGACVRFYRVQTLSGDDAVAQFPELENDINHAGRSQQVELVQFIDRQRIGLFTTIGSGRVLRLAANPLGQTMVHIFKRPGLLDEEIGQFDDVIPVQVAKARLATLQLEAAEKSVQAPMAMPSDVLDFELGPESVLKSATPEKIRRVDLPLSPGIFAQASQLDDELRRGARHPDPRTGNTDASIVTGRGVDALMGGFDTQIQTFHEVARHGLGKLIAWCFAADEKLWPSVEKETEGALSGTPYKIRYRPDRDIKGDHTVVVTYGLLAGLSPNQALVFVLQALGAGLVSKDYGRRQMPFGLDAAAEEARIEIETLRSALQQGMAGLGAALPAMATQGQDPSDVIARLATVLEQLQRGKSIEEATSVAFPLPQPEPQPDPAADPAAQGMPGGTPPGMDPLGMMQGVAPGQAHMGPGGRPDVMSLLANVGSRGQGNLDAGVIRRLPAK